MAYIPEHIVQQIRESADILEVVSDFVTLKQKGTNWWALSPFTDEKTPSFSVNPSRNIFKCFSTGIGGDAVKFVMEVEKLTYPEALRYLAQKYHIEIEEQELSDEEKAKKNQRESLFIIMDFARKHYQNLLKNDTEEGFPLGMSYFKERGFSVQTIENFSLGYSKNSWNYFEDEALKNKFQKNNLIKAGLILENREKKTTYDRFRGRVMFPIRDLAGKTIAFGARTLKKDDNPKYLNSPETPIYHKSDILYGIYEAKNHIRKENNCFLTEGYTDVISLHQNGIQNVVASSGTSLTENQIKLIKRFTENVTVLYDGDSAGIKASLRGIDMLLEKNLNIKIVLFPDGEDPDSYAQKLGQHEFSEFLATNQQDFITFKTEFYLKNAQNDPLKRAEAIREVVSSISKVPDRIKKSVFFQKCAELFEVSEAVLVEESNQILRRQQQRQQKQKEQEKRRADRTENLGKVSKEKSKNSVDSLPPSPPKADIPTEVEGDFWADLPPEISAPPVDFPPENLDTEKPKEDLQSGTLGEIITKWEKECIRFLLLYGQNILDENIKVWEYLFEETEELEFHTDIYREILEIYKSKLADGLEIDVEYLIRTGKPEIVEVVSDFAVEKHTVSQHWFGKYEIYVAHEKELLPDGLFKHILSRKHLIIKELIIENTKKLAQNPSPEDEEKILKTHLQLQSVQIQLAQQLGTAVNNSIFK